VINDGRHSLKLMFTTANAVCNRFVAVTAECDQVGKTLLAQRVWVVEQRRTAVFVMDLQVFATAASLTAVSINVKPLLALFSPDFRDHVFAVVISGWFLHEGR
jgi:hypothetical protein